MIRGRFFGYRASTARSRTRPEADPGTSRARLRDIAAGTPFHDPAVPPAYRHRPGAAVPHLSLQPIVENCIRHGIEKSATAGRISVAANRVDGTLAIVVTDDGPGVAADNGADNRGIGLANTRARLAQLYGDRASLTIRAATADTGGTVVTMVLPFHPAPVAGNRVEVHASEHADRGR